MRCHRDTSWLWNTGQDKKRVLNIFFILLYVCQVWARPDFLDAMSQQFFGISSESNGQSQQQNYQQSPDPFAQMFGSPAQPVPQRTPPRSVQNPNHRQRNRPHQPHRQGYYAPPHAVQQQVHLPYSGPPPVYGQQQGFGQRQPNSNETKTEGYPSDAPRPHHHPQQHPPHTQHPYPPGEHHPQYVHLQQPAPVEYHKPPTTVVEYQPQYPQHPPEQVEYHHIPQQPVVVQEHHHPSVEIHPGTEHAYHEPPTHVEYHHPPEVEYHHYTTEKPKRFHLSFLQNPEYKIIDKHLKLPPVKFRFHINPKIVITSNTKDPLDKKHHDDEHDLEPFPPPDVFSDPNAPPSYNSHQLDLYPPKHHHYPVEHHAVKHYVAEHPQIKHPYPVEHHVVDPHIKHAYPVEHHVVDHHPVQEFTYDLSHGHSHINPHRSLGHYEPTFKVKTKPIIFTEPPPTRPPTTTRATTTTARTTTARTTRRTTTARTTRRTTTARTTRRTTTTAMPTIRARISARNPAFSVAFTQDSTTASTTEASTTSSTTTRRSIFRSSSERESENGVISERRDELSTSENAQPTRVMTTTTTTTTPKTTSPTTTATTKLTSTTTTTLKPTSAATTTSTTRPETTTASTTSTTTTTQKPSTTQRPTVSTAISQPTRFTPAEETTPRTTTLSNDANEIDMRETTEASRRRPEPLLGESSTVDRSGSYNLENSESVKVIETTMLIDGKNQTVRFYYITEPVKLPLDVFQKMTGQSKDNPSGLNVIKIRDKRYAVNMKSFSNKELETLHYL